MKASILIPILNEARFIENCVQSVIGYIKDRADIELLLIDGGSDDGTIEILKDLAENHPLIKILHNPNKIQASALNIGIRESTGEYIIRLDAHAKYSEKYIKNCINYLDKSSKEVANVGGAITTMPGANTFIAKTISFVLQEKFGVGDSAFRTENILEEMDVETVPFGCFRRSCLEEVGFFNENLERGEDLEINKRLASAGKRIIISPDIQSIYYSRPTFLSFIDQAFRNGFFVTNTLSLKNIFHKLRHFIPLAFVCFIFMLTLSLSWGYQEEHDYAEKFLISILLIYLMISGFVATKISLKNKNFAYLFSIPLILFCLHMSYGIGSLTGIIKKRT